jgi:hypothetical protein
MSIMSTVKEHPYMVAVGVFVAGVLLVIIMFSGNGQEAAPQPVVDDTGAIQANAAITTAQIQAQVQSNAIAADLQGRLADTAASREIALAQVAGDKDATTLQAEVARLQVQAQAQTEQQIATLSAQVSNNQIAAQTAQAQIMSGMQISMQQALADVQKHSDDVQFQMVNSNNAAQVAMATKFAQTQVSMASIYSNQQVALANLDMQKAAALAQIQASTLVQVAAYDYGKSWNESSLRANVAQMEYMTAAPGSQWDPSRGVMAYY